MHEPLVSVIIPAYNAKKYLRATLQSVLAQTYTNIEVLVVDDGSTDNTPAIVERFARNDSRVRLLRQRNLGVAAARNLGIRESSGEFIAPVDADDLWSPFKIERQVECLQQAGPRAGLAYCWTIGIDDAGFLLYFSGRPQNTGEVLAQHLRRNFIGNASVPLFRREALEQVGVYRTEFKQRGGQGCEDWDLTLRVAEQFEFCVVPEFLVGYRSVCGSMSWNHDVMKRSYELMIEDLRERRPELVAWDYRVSKSVFTLYLVRFRLRSGRMFDACRGLSYAFWLHPGIVAEQFASATYVRCVRFYHFLFRLHRTSRLPFDEVKAMQLPEVPVVVTAGK